MGSRLGIYNWPPVYISWVREKWLQTGHLQLVSCLHFLRQEVDGFQVRHLNQSPIFSQTGSYDRDRVNSQALSLVDALRQQSWQEQRGAKPHLSKGSSDFHFPPPWGKEDTTHAQKGSLGVNSQGDNARR